MKLKLRSPALCDGRQFNSRPPAAPSSVSVSVAVSVSVSVSVSIPTSNSDSKSASSRQHSDNNENEVDDDHNDDDGDGDGGNGQQQRLQHRQATGRRAGWAGGLVACSIGFHLTLSCNVLRLRVATANNRSRSTSNFQLSASSGFSVDFHINKWPR